MESLSYEQLYPVLLELDASDIIKFSQINKNYKKIYNDNYLWALKTERDYHLPIKYFLKLNNYKQSPFFIYDNIDMILSLVKYEDLLFIIDELDNYANQNYETLLKNIKNDLSSTLL